MQPSATSLFESKLAIAGASTLSLAIKMKNRLGIVLALCLMGCDSDADPKGEGSTSAGDEMFAEIANVPSGIVPPGYTRFDFADGSWIAVRGIDSHKSPDGGTVGIVTNTGESAVIFTHVCGPGPTPLEGLIPDAESATKALASVRASSKEYKNANKP